MDLAEKRIVHLGRRQRHVRMAGVVDRGDGRGSRPLGPQRHQLQRGFLLGVHTEQAVQVGVDEPGVETRSEPERPAHRQEVSQERPGVPEEVAVPARLILPRVPPVDRGQDDRHRAAGGRLVCRRAGEFRPHVARAKAAQGEVAGAEVVEPGFEPFDLARRDIDLRLIQGARRRGRAEQDLAAARVGPLLGHPRRVVENGRDVGQRHALGTRRTGAEGGERVDRERIDLPRQRERGKVGVDLEREGLDVPVEGVGARADRRRRVRRLVVIGAGDARLAVRDHRGLTSLTAGWTGAPTVSRNDTGGGRRRAR